MIKKIFTALRAHYFVFTLAIVVGLIYGSHHFWIPRFLDHETETYYPVTFGSVYHDEAISYGARANAFYQGDFIVGDIRLVEYKNGPSWMPLLNPMLMGGLGRLFGALKNGLIASDFIFPPLIFIVVYFLLFEITTKRAPSLLFSSLFIFSPMFGMLVPPVTALNLQLLKEALLPFLDNDMPLVFSFFEEPKITFLFYALAAYFLYRSLSRGGAANTIMAGVTFGALFYTYFYDWASFSVALGLLLAFFMFQRDFRHAKQTCAIIGIGITVSSWYWASLVQTNVFYEYGDIVARIGPEISRQFRFVSVWKSYFRIITLVVALWYFLRKKNAPLFSYIAAFLLSYFVVMNAQIVTGFNIQPDHWYRTQFFVTAVVVFLLGFWFFEKYVREKISPKFRVVSFVAVFVFFFGSHAYSEYAYSATYFHEFAMSRETIARYEWLQENTEKLSVVGTFSFEDAYNISLYTHNRLFVPIGTDTAASENEIWNRFIILAKLQNVPISVFAKAIKSPQILRPLFSHLYDYGKSFDSDFKGGVGCCKLPEGFYGAKILDYALIDEKYQQKIPYNLDYLLVDNAEKNILSDFSMPSFFRKVYDDGKVRIYEKTQSRIKDF